MNWKPFDPICRFELSFIHPITSEARKNRTSQRYDGDSLLERSPRRIRKFGPGWLSGLSLFHLTQRLFPYILPQVDQNESRDKGRSPRPAKRFRQLNGISHIAHGRNCRILIIGNTESDNGCPDIPPVNRILSRHSQPQTSDKNYHTGKSSLSHSFFQHKK